LVLQSSEAGSENKWTVNLSRVDSAGEEYDTTLDLAETLPDGSLRYKLIGYRYVYDADLEPDPGSGGSGKTAQDNVRLKDAVTGEEYLLYVSNGKLMMNKAEG
jgi:hypothetical protein